MYDKNVPQESRKNDFYDKADPFIDDGPDDDEEDENNMVQNSSSNNNLHTNAGNNNNNNIVGGVGVSGTGKLMIPECIFRDFIDFKGDLH